MEVGSADADKCRLDLDLAFADFRSGDVVFDLDVFLAVEAGGFHGFAAAL